MSRRFFSALTLAVLSSAGHAADADANQPDASGVGVEFAPQRQVGLANASISSYQLRFKLADKATGYPITGMHPSAWVQERVEGEEFVCRDRIKSLLRGGVSTKADADLNGFYIVTLNADHSVAILNPLVRLGTSNLAALIRLKDAPGGWALDDARGRLLVSMPNSGEVALIDVKSRALTGYLALGKQARSLARDATSELVWAGAQDAIYAIEPGVAPKPKRVALGGGAYQVLVDGQGDYVLAAALAESATYLVDARTRKVEQSYQLGRSKSATYSHLSSAFYIAHAAQPVVSIVRPGQAQAQQLQLPAPAHMLAVSPDGKYLLALLQNGDTVLVYETASHQLIGRAQVGPDADYIAFGKDHAYVRNAGAANVSLFQMAQIGSDRSIAVATITTGVKAPGSEVAFEGATPFARLPGDDAGSLILNPADRVIYYHAEGMMAPKNSFKTYTAPPLAMLTYDRSLRETRQQGDYEASATLPGAGRYDVMLFLDSPRIASCFELVVPGKRRAKKREGKPIFEALYRDQRFSAARLVQLRFQLRNSAGKVMTGLKQVQVLAYERGGNWQKRALAKANRQGVLSVELSFPRPGQYGFMVEGGGLRFRDTGRELITVHDTQVAARD